MGGLQHFSVSPRPLGFCFFSFRVLGLRVWAQGLTTRLVADRDKPVNSEIFLLVKDVNYRFWTSSMDIWTDSGLSTN